MIIIPHKPDNNPTQSVQTIVYEMINILLFLSYTICTIDMVLTSVLMFYKFHQVISMQSPCQVGCGIRLSDAIASSTHLSWGQWKPWQNHWWKSFVVHAGHNFWMFGIFFSLVKQIPNSYFRWNILDIIKALLLLN